MPRKKSRSPQEELIARSPEGRRLLAAAERSARIGWDVNGLDASEVFPGEMQYPPDDDGAKWRSFLERVSRLPIAEQRVIYSLVQSALFFAEDLRFDDKWSDRRKIAAADELIRQYDDSIFTHPQFLLWLSSYRARMKTNPRWKDPLRDFALSLKAVGSRGPDVGRAGVGQRGAPEFRTLQDFADFALSREAVGARGRPRRRLVGKRKQRPAPKSTGEIDRTGDVARRIKVHERGREPKDVREDLIAGKGPGTRESDLEHHIGGHTPGLIRTAETLRARQEKVKPAAISKRRARDRKRKAPSGGSTRS